MDLDDDIDVYSRMIKDDGMDLSLGFGCEMCQRPFCHGCVVSHLGMGRCCLDCVGRKRWVGGLGWVSV